MQFISKFDWANVEGKPILIDGVIDSSLAFILQEISNLKPEQPTIFVARSEKHFAELKQVLGFLDPQKEVVILPGWDCLPYDRVSPSPAIMAERLSAFYKLLQLQKNPTNTIILTSAKSLLQKIAPASTLKKYYLRIKLGQQVKVQDLTSYLIRSGFTRVELVEDVGEFAIRGGVVDVFLPGEPYPLRLDFFGDELESIKAFSPIDQRSIKKFASVLLKPMSEIILTDKLVERFRVNYIKQFGGMATQDSLYQAVSDKRSFAGQEHWMPLFYEKLDTVFDYFGANYTLVLDHLLFDSLEERSKLIYDYYDARINQDDTIEINNNIPSYRAITPDQLYLTLDEIKTQIQAAPINIETTSFKLPTVDGKILLHALAEPAYNFKIERNKKDGHLFKQVADYLQKEAKKQRKILIAGWSEGSLQRLLEALKENNLAITQTVANMAEFLAIADGNIVSGLLMIEQGLDFANCLIIGEQDILGDRFIRTNHKQKTNKKLLSDYSVLNSGDYVVHIDHGIGKFTGLRCVEIGSSKHECLEIVYAGNDKLLVPVENLEILSKYSNENATVTLDKLGGVAWQARKAKLKKRLLEIASELLEVAAKRKLRTAPIISVADSVYAEFVARFPYDETADQLSAIDAVLADLKKGHPMDRLICGDVGFGKTEVALRAAFVAAMSGYQVAVLTPTTLLARQHYKNFSTRLQGFPVNIAMLSRLVSSKDVPKIKQDIADGTVSIAIGTHALLSNNLNFNNLGLVIIDEEQHFGVLHKEKLKKISTDVHVLTLSATPIPRTLQLALSGVQDLSLITTPPLDRMAVRTFVSPFDPLIIRETLLREHYRGGQSFYVCPRVSDLDFIANFLSKTVPELKVVVAHGQMAAGKLDQIMNAFYDGEYDILLATTIIESGLDIPRANTLIVHRADMFGLAASYQLRGRVGRSIHRAYALFTISPDKPITNFAEQRLKILQSLDKLGAGFELAHHDLDLRGAGNILGQEQSGHIKEVGYELYQSMLEEVMAQLQGEDLEADSKWSPQISMDISVMIPESYIADLQLRLNLYKRLSQAESLEDIEAFSVELVDRFGKFPVEVHSLIKIVYIKILCRQLNIEKLDAGAKGMVIYFRDKSFANPIGLIDYLAKQNSMAKIREDQSIVLLREWSDINKRIKGVINILQHLLSIVE